MKHYWKYLRLALIGLLVGVWVYSLTLEPEMPKTTNDNYTWQTDDVFTIK